MRPWNRSAPAVGAVLVALVLGSAPSGMRLLASSEHHHHGHLGHGEAAATTDLYLRVGDDGDNQIATDLSTSPGGGTGDDPSNSEDPRGPDVGVPGFDGSHLPNLRPRPAYDVQAGEPDGPLTGIDSAFDFLQGGSNRPSGRMLRFTTTIENRGNHGFELLGVPGVPDASTSEVLTTEAFQCVGFGGPALYGSERVCGAYARVGTLTWHAHHQHFHINGFASYWLRRDDGGQPMFGPGSVVAASDKVGWCVSDMEYLYADQPERHPPDGYRPWYSECTGGIVTYGLASFRQGISPGWADTYPWHFAGQQIPIDGVPDGIYWIAVSINPPANRAVLSIRESDYGDNTSFTRVRLSEGGTKVDVLD